MGMSDHDFKFGVSKIFFRAGKFAEFDELLNLDPAKLAALVTKVQKWIAAYRWKRAIYGTLCVIKCELLSQVPVPCIHFRRSRHHSHTHTFIICFLFVH